MKRFFFLIISFVAFQVASEAQKKVLLAPFWVGSHFRNVKDLGLELVKQNYNVSVLLVEDSKYAPSIAESQMTIIYYPGVNQSYVSHLEKLGSLPNATAELTLRMYSLQLECTKNPQWIQFMKDQHFQLHVRGFFPAQNDLATILDIPLNLLLHMTPLDSFFMKKTIGLPSHSTQISNIKHFAFPAFPELDEDLGRSTFWQRFIYFLSAFPSEYFQQRSMDYYTSLHTSLPFQSSLHQAPKNDLVLYVAVDGILEQYSVAPNVKSVYPFIKKDEKKEGVTEEQLQFLEQFEKVMLVCFGTVFWPKDDFIPVMQGFASKHREWGIIISLKEDKFPEGFLNGLKSEPNVLSQKWVSQKQLLQMDKIKIFYGHGGYFSILEALESGTALIVTPLVISDQTPNCIRIQKNGYGYCLGKPTLEMVQSAVQKIEQNNFFKEKLSHVSRVMKLKREDPHDTLYWIDYLFTVGTEHLIPKDTIELSFFALTELDVHLALYLLLLTVIMLIGLTLKCCWRLACGKKEEASKVKRE